MEGEIELQTVKQRKGRQNKIDGDTDRQSAMLTVIYETAGEFKWRAPRQQRDKAAAPRGQRRNELNLLEAVQELSLFLETVSVW